MIEPADGRPAALGGGPPRALSVAFVSLPRALTATLILAGIAVNFANVISRYVFDFALFWAEEIMVFIVVWCVFIGAVAVAFNGDHLRMDLFSARIAGRWKTAVNGAAAASLIGFGAFAAYQSYLAVSVIGRAGQVSVSAGVPMVIPHAAILIGLVLTVAVVALRLRAYVTGRF